jgi:hypothetical protein
MRISTKKNLTTKSQRNMNKALITFIILITTFGCVQSQIKSDSLVKIKNAFFMDGKPLTYKQVVELVKDYPEAVRALKKAKANHDAAIAFGYIGGFFLGYPLGQAIAGGEPAWALAGAGAGSLLIALLFQIAYNMQAKKAIRIYNSGLNQLSLNYNASVNFCITMNGLSVIMNK